METSTHCNQFPVPLGEITGVLLMGGHSSRMGSPKEKLPVGSETFLTHILGQFPAFYATALSVAAGSEVTAPLPVWPDRYPDCGPIGAICTALERAETPYVFFCPCDTPCVTEGLFLTLCAALRPGDDAVVPSAGGHVHPLTGLYRTSLLPAARSLIDQGCHRPRRLLDMVATRYLELDEELSCHLRNINTPEEYAAWQGEVSAP